MVEPVGFVQVWDSRGTNTPRKGSVWAAKTDGPLGSIITGRNKVRVSLGQYVSAGDGPPRGCGMVELEDAKAWDGRLLIRALPHLLPHPVNYRQVWTRSSGRRELFVWRPLPPSDRFVALGVVCTTSSSPPPLDAVRCVPNSWVTPCSETPEKSWDDSGSNLGGKPGSLWTLSGFAMRLMVAMPGYQPPTDPLQLKDGLGSFQLSSSTLPLAPDT